MARYGVLWCAIVCYGALWCATVRHGRHGVLWPAMVCYGVLLWAMPHYGVLWRAMAFYGVPWCAEHSGREPVGLYARSCCRGSADGGVLFLKGQVERIESQSRQWR